jgi:hypothetical protein
MSEIQQNQQHHQSLQQHESQQKRPEQRCDAHVSLL